METASSKLRIFISGQIESATFPLGSDADEIFCRYELIAGPDWQIVSGLQSEITQTANNKNGKFNDQIVFNMPIEATFKSTSLFGWPQMIISIFGKVRWGTETLVGYSRVHIPVFGTPCDHETSIISPILTPKPTNIISDIVNRVTARNSELKNPHILLDNTKTKGLFVESYGWITLRLSTIRKGTSKLGYEL